MGELGVDDRSSFWDGETLGVFKALSCPILCSCSLPVCEVNSLSLPQTPSTPTICTEALAIMRQNKNSPLLSCSVRWSPRDENLLIGTTRVQNFLLRASMLPVQGLLCRNLPPDTCLCVGVSSFTYVGGVQIAASWAKFAIRFRN